MRSDGRRRRSDGARPADRLDRRRRLDGDALDGDALDGDDGGGGGDAWLHDADCADDAGAIEDEDNDDGNVDNDDNDDDDDDDDDDNDDDDDESDDAEAKHSDDGDY